MMVYKETSFTSVAEIRMLYWMCGNPQKDKVRNVNIQAKVGMALSKRRCEKIT